MDPAHTVSLEDFNHHGQILVVDDSHIKDEGVIQNGDRSDLRGVVGIEKTDGRSLLGKCVGEAGILAVDGS